MAEEKLGVKLGSNVHEIDLGRVKTFLVETKDGKLILIDTGLPKSEKKIIKYINSIGKSVSDVKYIFLTHAHIDHFGSAYAMQKLTSAHVGIHNNGIKFINGESGLLLPRPKQPSSAQTKFMMSFMKFFLALNKPKFLKPDMALKEGVMPADMGVDLKILETPGHTSDSISVYLPESKVVIIGDMLYGGPSKLVIPRFFEDYVTLLNSINKIKSLGQDVTVCVSHGKDHTVADIEI